MRVLHRRHHAFHVELARKVCDVHQPLLFDRVLGQCAREVRHQNDEIDRERLQDHLGPIGGAETVDRDSALDLPQRIDQLAETCQILGNQLFLKLEGEPVAAHVELAQTVADVQYDAWVAEGVFGKIDEESQLVTGTALLGEHAHGVADRPFVDLLDQPASDRGPDEILGLQQLARLVEQAYQDAVVLLVVAHQADDGLVDELELLVAERRGDLLGDLRVPAHGGLFGAGLQRCGGLHPGRAVLGRCRAVDAQPVGCVEDVLRGRCMSLHEVVADIAVRCDASRGCKALRQAGVLADVLGECLGLLFIQVVDNHGETIVADSRERMCPVGERGQDRTEAVDDVQPMGQTQIAQKLRVSSQANEKDHKGQRNRSIGTEPRFDLLEKDRAGGGDIGRHAVARCPRRPRWIKDQTQAGLVVENGRRSR